MMTTVGIDLLGEVLAPPSDDTVKTQLAIPDVFEAAASGCRDIAATLAVGTDRWAELAVTAQVLAVAARRRRAEAGHDATA